MKICGAVGYVSWYGTQFHSTKEINQFNIPTSNARTLAVIGNLKEMSLDFLRGALY